MNKKEYIAHYDHRKNRSHFLLEHLNCTAKLAGEFAQRFRSGQLANAIAQVHDLGKYSERCQRRIRGENITVDHSTPGGQLIWQENNSFLGMIAAYCIMGHHGGLPDGGGSYNSPDDPTLCGRRTRTTEDCSAFKSELNLPLLEPPEMNIRDGFSAAFLIRMLFSSLVDADYLDTEEFYLGKNCRKQEAIMPELLNRFMHYIEAFLNPKEEVSELNMRRTELLKNCLATAKDASGLFTLTAPTGSGKTIASLAFALNHNKDRIIYVVPYNTIIEQNAKVFEDILGKENVLQHHFNIQYDDESEESSRKRLASENWDYPVIVTSSVQFFQSLFHSRPSVCRKLHNIANSVLIFDEAQMIPIPHLIPCVRGIRELIENYECSAVLATATQSALDDKFEGLKVREITKNPRELYSYLRRTNIKFIYDAFTEDDFVERIRNHERVLCIVNTRRTAHDLFIKLSGLHSEGIYHLSTYMYPEHRSRVLNEIRQRLKNKLSCRVISTSLVEAGVDIDFPYVYREEAGLDSIIQAAGRCNREGTLNPSEATVYVFKFAGAKPPPSMVQNIAAAEIAVRGREDMASLDAIKTYFEQLFYIKGDEALDVKNVVRKLNENLKSFLFPFREIANDFKLIEEDTQTVYVLTDRPELAERVCNGEQSRDLFRQLTQYGLSLYPSHVRELYSLGAVTRPSEYSEILLLSDSYYDKNCGVSHRL